MNKFENLLSKELKELLTLKMVLPFALSLLILLFVSQMMKKEGQKSSFAADIMVADFDKTSTSADVVAALNLSGYTVKSLELSPVESLVMKAVNKNVNVLITIPENFEKMILKKKGAEINFYMILKSLSIRETVQRTLARNVVSVINKWISDKYIKEMSSNIDPSLVTNPIKAREFVYLKGKLREGSGQAIIAIITMQTIFVPVILFVLIIFAGTMIASSLAQEKENKTLETLLTVPISRFSIVAAKMAAAMILACIFAGIFLFAFGTFMSGMTAASTQDMKQAQEAMKSLPMDFGLSLGFSGNLLLGISIFLSIVLALSIATLLAVFTQEVKDVQAAIMPLMLLILIPYFVSILMDPHGMNPILKVFIFAIPFSHTFFAFKYLILGEIMPVIFGVFYLSFITFVLLFITLKIFSSDKILTMKFSFGFGMKKR